MNRTSTTLDYSRRIERAALHIGQHLDDPLDLDGLAAIACFSPYHFHRIYRAMMGETAAETVRRLRLSRAAGQLVQGTASIAGIARRAGYGSIAAFTRAFGTDYGATPAQYRRQGRLVQSPISSSDEELAMQNVTIRQLEPVRLAAFAHSGPYIEIGSTFDRLFAWAAGRGLVGPAMRSLGVYYDDPNAVPADQLRSAAGVVVSKGEKIEAPAKVLDLAGGRHAVLRHQGPYAELEGAYRWLYREWLPASGEEPADRPCFEEYLNNPRELPPAEWLTDVCLPLADR